MNAPNVAPDGASDVDLTSMILGHMQSRIVHVAVEAGIIDALDAAPTTSSALAAACFCERGATLRLLRGLVALGLAREPEPDQFASSARADPLRSGARSSLRGLVLMLGSERAWHSWAHMMYSVQTGIPASHHLFNMTADEYFAKNEGAAALHAQAMGELAGRVADALVDRQEFARFDTVVDIGGDDGRLLMRILADRPGLAGTLLVKACRMSDVRARVVRAGLRERCELATGKLFDPMPEGRDAYLMKSVLRDWADDRCIAILQRVRDAMRQDSELLLVERLMPQQLADCPAHRLAAITDLNLLVMTGGRQRTLAQIDRLLAGSSLRRAGEPVPLAGTSESLLAVRRLS